MTKRKSRTAQNYKKLSAHVRRLSKKYKKARQNRLIAWKRRNAGIIFRPEKNATPIDLKTPSVLNFIQHSDEIIEYFKLARSFLKQSVPIKMDLSDVTEMTPDSIAVLVSQITSFRNFRAKISGNEPKDPKTRRIFRESGFYKFVKSNVKKRGESDSNLMHKESSHLVVTEIANRGTDIATNNRGFSIDEVESIYNIFIELMSNTHHHASKYQFGVSKWWLYIYTDNVTSITSICFVDLGVGIFRSIVVRDYINKFKHALGISDNIDFIDDLINGKIASRIEKDNEIRGKGLPQIISYACMDIFSKFYMISNNVKVDFKTNDKVKLKNNFAGTMF